MLETNAHASDRLASRLFPSVMNRGFPISALALLLACITFASAAPTSLRMLTQNNYLPGLPVLVRVEGLAPDGRRDRETWDIDTTLTADGGVTLSTNKIALRNGMGSLLVTFTGGSDFNLTATVGGVTVTRALHSVAGDPVTKVGGILSGGSGTWSGLINVTSDVIVTNYTLTIQSNTLVLIDGVSSGTVGVDIFVNANGSIQSLGTELHPVTITCSNLLFANRWGQIRHNSSQPSLYRHTFIHRAGRAVGEGHTGQAAAIRTAGSTLTFESTTISDLCETSPAAPGFGTPAKVMFALSSVLSFNDCLFQRARTGPEIDGTSLLFTNSYVLETRGPDDSDGFYVHAQQGGQTVKITDCVFGMGDDDGIDTLGPVMTIENCLFREWNNLLEDAKGISVFDGVTDVRHCLFTDCTVAIAAKTTASVRVNINNTTFMGNLTNVLAAYKANAPGPMVELRITNSIIWGGNNPVHSDFEPLSSNSTNFIIRYCDIGEAWTGAGNINSDPLFVNAAAKNFRVTVGSPTINAGDPASPVDVDGSRVDQGYFPFLTSTGFLVSTGAVWKYLDNGTDQGTNWSQRLFDDNSWSNGPAQLGYGDGDEATVVGFGPNAASKYITTYFRRAFTVLNPAEFTNLVASLTYDDGAVVYLNGVEAYRVNLPAGAVANGTLALAPVENPPLATANISPTLLVTGTNVLAVEMHQVTNTSSDISFDFQLVGQRAQAGPLVNQPPVVNITSPPDGAGYITPADIAISVSATDNDGTVTNVNFYQNGSLLWQTNAGPYNYTWAGVGVGSYALTAVATDNSGASSTSATVSVTVSVPSAATVTNVFIAYSNIWKYLDNGTDQGAFWRSNSFNDSSWTNGQGQLGYGDGDEATVVGYGPSVTNKYITTYFRRAFSVINAAAFTNLSLRLIRDDGGVIYLNGAEIFRTPNMPAGNILYNNLTVGAAPPDNTVDTVIISGSVGLLEGTNVIAVEIHQQAVASSDISFDLQVTGIRLAETNAKPVIAITNPANGTFLAVPANIAINASASDPDGTVTNVAFYVNGVKLGDDITSPFALTTNNVPAGSYALVAVATDNVGQTTTSSVVNVTVSTNIAPPVVFAKIPAPGSVTNLTNITVTFSKVVAGVNASDLLVNGLPATGLSGSGSNYTFSFTQPAFGPVVISWVTGHGITDTFVPSHAFDTNSAGANWSYQLLDSQPPTVTTITPLPGSTVAALTSIAVTFSEPVTGVNAGDLLLNAAPATGLSGAGAGPYTFSFAQPAQGVVNVSWAGGHGVADVSGNPFSPVPWSYTLDSNSVGIVISEIMYHAASENPLDEWLELYNKGGTTVNLAGWRVTAGFSFTFSNVALLPGGYLVVASDTNYFRTNFPTVTNVVGNWVGSLNNNGENINLKDAAGNLVNSVTYADNGDWAVRQRGDLELGHRGWEWHKPHDGRGASLELINPNLPNDSGENWAANATTNATPGRVNSVNTNNVAPLILEVTHFPTIPRSTEQVTVSARLLDEAASGYSANLFWRVDSTTPPAFTSTVMHDDGLNGDLVASDGLWSARLPVQANNAVIEFYVSATDAQGLNRTWPRAAIAATDGAGPTGQVVNALFQIDDATYAPTNAQPMFKLIMTANEAAELASIPGISTLQGPNSAMNGTAIIIDGGGINRHYSVGFRNRGHGSRQANPPNYRIEFRDDDRWKGVQAINLNSQYVHAQHLGSVLARKAGVAGANTYAAQARVNNVNRAVSGQPMFGSYAANESQDSDYAARHYPHDPNGSVYRAIRDIAPPEFSYRGTNYTAYTNTWFKESNASENYWGDLISMLSVVGTGNPVPFTTANVRAVVNVEQWMNHFALMNLLGNNETGLNTGFNDDYFIYAGVNDPRLILTYYDLDTILGEGGSLAPTTGLFTSTANNGSGVAMDRFLNWPDFTPIYYKALSDILTGPFAQSNFNATVDETLGGYVPVGTIGNIKAWMNSRRSFVLGLLPPITYSNGPTAIVTGVPRSPTPITAATLTVSAADAATYQFSLNGGAYSAETPLATPITLSALGNGTNTVRVLARGTNGVWQLASGPTIVSWVVNNTWPAVRLNEVLARNVVALNHNSTFPDAIELFNEGSATMDLGGLRLSNDKDQPSKYTFPSGTLLASGAYLTVYANNIDGTPGIHLGFNLDANGDSVRLFAAVTDGGLELDAVKFGRQLADLSIGRFGNVGDWKLAQPSFGAANVVQPLGSPHNLRINEWLADSQGQEDFVELYNPNALPVALGGLYFTDNLLGDPALNPLDALTFIGAGEFRAFTANGNGNGGDHLNFSLALEQGEIGLFDETLKVIDCVIYSSQQPDVAQGRCPNGGVSWTSLGLPTPGAPNACLIIAPGGAVVINEVLADNRSFPEPDGSLPDWIEIYNPTGTNINLGDMSLTDDTIQSRRWIFPSNSVITSLGFLKVRFDAGLPSSTTNTGFGLSANGGSVYLFDKLANGGSPLSAISYGLQAADFSIGRVPNGSSNWVLTVPSFGGNNLAAALGNATLLKINEWMANPSSGSDYFEIFNPNPQPVDISRFYLTDTLVNRTKHQLPALSFMGVGQDAYQKFDADSNPTAGADHVNFSLAAGGEALGLTSSNNIAVDTISFGPQSLGVSQGRLPDGAAAIVNFPTTPTPGKSNFLPLSNVVVNELLAHTDPPLEDAVEFYNPGTTNVNIGGWYLSDSQNNLLKYRVPTNTVIPAGGYVVFYEYQFNPDVTSLSFSFSSAKGDNVYLSQSFAPGTVTGYRAYAEFGASENGVSFGRFLTSVGADFTAMSARTFGQDNPVTTNQFRLGTGLTNTYPKVGPVVINEIMYHPVSTNEVYEFIELRNITAVTVPLFDTNNPANTWRVRKGVDFNFLTGTSIPAGGYLVLVSFDPVADPASLALFRSAYGTNMTLAGPYLGKLDNTGEALELQRPDAPQTVPGPDFGLVPYLAVDRVVYGDTAPWPASPDGFGDALKKTTSSLYGNEPLNWQGGAPTPGAANFAGASDTDGDGMPDAWEIQYGLNPNSAADANTDLDGDGATNLQEYLAGTNPTQAGSVLRITSIETTGVTNARLSFFAVSNKTYAVEYKNTLNDPGWLTVTNLAAAATNRTLIINTTVPATNRFYRVRTP